MERRKTEYKQLEGTVGYLVGFKLSLGPSVSKKWLVSIFPVI